MTLIENINEKLDQIIEISKTNSQLANYVQKQLEKMTTYILQNEVAIQNNTVLDITDPRGNRFQSQLHPDVPPALNCDSASAKSLLNPPNPSVLTQAVIQGLVKQEISTEKDRVKQKLAGFDSRQSPACIYINNHFGADIHQQTLIDLAKKIAKKRQIVLDRDSKRRKTVLLKWFHDHWNVIRTDFENTQLLDGKLITNYQG